MNNVTMNLSAKIAMAVRRADGKIRYDDPECGTRYITDEQWAEIVKRKQEATNGVD